MRELAILTFVTLDGVMQGPGSPEEDPSGGFVGGGWAAPYWEEVMAQVWDEAMAAPYDILFGRKTYEIFAGYWPKSGEDNPVSAKMNAARKYVVTNTLDRFDWANSEPVRGDAVEAVGDLKKQDGPLLQVHGSGGLIQSLLAADLIDELRLWTFPVVVGSGRRLFGDVTVPSTLRLTKSAACANGAVMSVYRTS